MRTKENRKKLLSYELPRPNFRASELNNCKRRMYYRLMGYVPTARTARGDDYGDDGDMHHDQMRKFMKKYGVKLSGLKFNKDGTVDETVSKVLKVKHDGIEFSIGMRLDGFIHLNNRKHLLEGKSMGFWKLKPIRETWERTECDANVLQYIEENRKDIMYQTHACMAATKVKSTYLLIKDRSDSAVGLHSYKNPDAIHGGCIIPFKQPVWNQLVRRLTAVQKAINDKVPPRPEYLPSTNECKLYCPFLHLCHGADKRKKQGKTPYIMHPQLGQRIHVEDL